MVPWVGERVTVRGVAESAESPGWTTSPGVGPERGPAVEAATAHGRVEAAVKAIKAITANLALLIGFMRFAPGVGKD